MRRTSIGWSPRIAAAALSGALVLSGCNGGDEAAAPQPEPTPTEPTARDRLDAAKQTLDETSSVHLEVTSEDVPTSGPALMGADGVAARPPSFEGELQAALAGGVITVQVISVDGTVYMQPPFSNSYSPTDPAEFGMRDPATLIDPDTGISSLLAEAENVEFGEERRIGGEVVQEVTADIPGEAVAELLRTADPSEPMDGTFAITEDDELRQAVLTGPFYSEESDSTYTIVLDQYGEDVEITAPE